MAPIAAYLWKRGSWTLTKDGNTHGRDMLLKGVAPKAGEIMKMPFLANTFKVSEMKALSSFYSHHSPPPPLIDSRQ